MAVTRDRGKSYGSAIKKGLPKADQIADKFHLDQNLTEKVKRYIQAKLSQYIYLDNNYNIVENKKDAIYILSRNRIIGYMYKGKKILKKDEFILVNKILKQNKEMHIVINEVFKFRNVTNNRDKHGLETIFKRWRNSEISLFKTYMRGIDDDIDAVMNCVKYKETNGLAEGKINKLKTVKRMLYGRASPELLKSRLFLSDYFHSIE